MEKASILGVRIHELHSKSLPNFNTDSTFNRINHKSIWKKLTQSYQRNCSHMNRIIDQCVPALWMQLYQKLNENKGIQLNRLQKMQIIKPNRNFLIQVEFIIITKIIWLHMSSYIFDCKRSVRMHILFRCYMLFGYG